ncbi:MAG: DUF973 family protein [Staphylothermus sp.]|nr:DUF973 family protein [Staphylothermus sp.]
METRKHELTIEGLRMIKNGALYVLLGSLIISITFVALIFILPLGIISTQPKGFQVPPIPHIIGSIGLEIGIPLFHLTALGVFSILALVILALLGAGLSLYGLYGKVIPGAERLATADSRYSTAHSLLKIGYLGGLILLIIGYLTLIIVIGIFLIFLAMVFLLLGKVGMALITFKLNEDYDESTMLIAGILFIIGIFIPPAELIAWILVYIGIDSVIRKAETRIQQFQPPTQPSTETPVI